jgi:hypothetical protein
MVWRDGKKRLTSTHRASWEIANGQISNDLCVLHKCDVPNCINPDHLFLGTRADNSKDMVSKERQKRGTQLPQAKLTESDIINIRNSNLSQYKLAKIFNTTQSNICQIINRKKWTHL